MLYWDVGETFGCFVTNIPYFLSFNKDSVTNIIKMSPILSRYIWTTRSHFKNSMNSPKDYFGKESFEEGRLFSSESVQEWFGSAIETVPVCYFEKVKAVGYSNFLLTHLSAVVAGIIFLRHFRTTRLFGRMIYSIFICVKYYVYWAIITFFLIIPYGILQENMSRPNILIKTLDEKYDVKQLNPG